MVSSQFMSAAGTALEDLLLAQVFSAVAGVDFEVLGNDIKPFAGLQTWADNLETQASNAINTANTAAATSAAVQTTVTANSAQIAALSATATGGTSGGTVFVDLFPTWDASNYNQFQAGTVGGLELINGQVGMNPSGDETSGEVIALSKTIFQTGSQSASIVLGAKNGAQFTYAGIYLCAAVDASSFAAALVGSGEVIIASGSHNNSSAVTTYTTQETFTVSLNTADTVTFEAIRQSDNTMIYEVIANGVVIGSWHDTGGVVPIGSAYRSFGFSQSYDWTGIVGYFGFAVASLTAADLASPAVVGTGWNLYMASTTSVALPGSGWQPLGASTLDTQGPVKGVTVTTLGTGVITIQQAGWYAIDFCCEMTSSAGTSNAFQAGIYRQSSGGAKVLIREGAHVEGGQVFMVSVSAVIQCAAGDQLSPAVWQAGSNYVIGAAGGAITYFTGALVSGNS